MYGLILGQACVMIISSRQILRAEYGQGGQNHGLLLTIIDRLRDREEHIARSVMASIDGFATGHPVYHLGLELTVRHQGGQAYKKNLKCRLVFLQGTRLLVVTIRPWRL